MNLTPYTKKIEVDAGYKAFYKIGLDKFTVIVNENGIKLTVDNRTGVPNGTGELMELFKPTLGMYQAKVLAEQMKEINYEEAIHLGFVLTSVVRVD